MVLTVLHAVVIAHWGTHHILPNSGPLVIGLTSIRVLILLSMAYLVLGRYELRQDPVSYWTGAGFACFGASLFTYSLVLPGTFSVERRMVQESLIAVSWIGTIGPIILIAAFTAASLGMRPWPGWLKRRHWLWSAAAWSGSGVCIILMVEAGEKHLPSLIRDDGSYTIWASTWQALFALLFALGAVLSVRAYQRTGERLLGYIALQQITSAFSLIALVIAGRRDELLGILDRFFSDGVVLYIWFQLLHEYVRLYRSEIEKTMALRTSEEQYRVLNQQLEERVVRRTGDLEKAVKELESFTYTVAHDLRAPLRHIVGFAGILLEDFSSEFNHEVQSYLRKIQEGTQRMGMLVDELLALAQVARKAPAFRLASLNSMVQEVVEILRPESREREVEWRIADLPCIECDATLLKQVFQNLLSNALKYSRPRPVAIIEVGQMRCNGEPAIFVRDNGVGFNMQYADKLFRVFQRLHRDEEFEGTGVGLATVQRIIEKHHGRVWAEATVDEGASFYFTLGGLEHAQMEEESTPVGEAL